MEVNLFDFFEKVFSLMCFFFGGFLRVWGNKDIIIYFKG